MSLFEYAGYARAWARQAPCALCLVLDAHVSYVMNSQHVPMFQYASCTPLNMLVVHGHGRGTHFGMCLVCAVCVVAIVVCVRICYMSLTGSIHKYNGMLRVALFHLMPM